MPISTFQMLCSAMFASSGKLLEKFNVDWTTLTVYGGSIIRHFGIRIITCILNNQKWKLLSHIVDVQGTALFGLKILRPIRVFTKHHRVYIETIDINFTNVELASHQLKERENGQSKGKHNSIAFQMPTVWLTAYLTPAEELVVPVQARRNNANVNVYLYLLLK